MSPPTIQKIRIQPIRIRQSQIGSGLRSEEITAWLNYNSVCMFDKQDNVYITSNYDSVKPYVSTTNSSADIFFHKKDEEFDSFEECYSGNDEQRKNEIWCKSLTTDKYYASVSKSCVAILKQVNKLPKGKRTKDTVVFLKIAEDGHYFCLLYYPFDKKRIELFDGGGSSLDIFDMRAIQYRIFKYLFRQDYEENSHLLTIVTKLGYQHSMFDEYCQTWVYLYLYKRVLLGYSVEDWNQFMANFVSCEDLNVNETDVKLKKSREKTHLGYTGVELTNKNRHALSLITKFREWYLESHQY